jgi:hypothetical protein
LSRLRSGFGFPAPPLAIIFCGFMRLYYARGLRTLLRANAPLSWSATVLHLISSPHGVTGDLAAIWRWN